MMPLLFKRSTLAVFVFCVSCLSPRLSFLLPHGPFLDYQRYYMSAIDDERQSYIRNPRLEQRDALLKVHQDDSDNGIGVSRRPAPPANACTADQLKQLKSMPQLQSKLSLTLESGCGDSDPWLEHFFLHNTNTTTTRQKNHKKTFLVIGCNKAVDAIGTARVMSRNAKSFDKKIWYDTMRNVSGLGWERFKSPCAKQKKQAMFEKGRFLRQVMLDDESSDIIPLEAHCVEPLPQNFDLIDKTLKQLSPRLSSEFQIHQYAVSNTTGTLLFPVDGVPGDESLGADSCLSTTNSGYNGSCAEVSVLSLDDFVKRHVTTTKDDSRSIDVLKIDVEGHDFQVLLGGTATLRQTKYLEFEYSDRNPWSSQRLESAVEYLDVTQGFTCYFMGKSARLFKLTKCFLPEHYERYSWSNVACVHRSQEEWAAHLEQLFLQTIG